MGDKGRNTKLTPEVIRKMCEALEGGNTRRVAALLAGIGESTFYLWMDKAKPTHKDHAPMFVDFMEQITHAEAVAEAEHVKNLQIQGIGDWRASESWLKRRRKDDWSEKQQIEQTVMNIDLTNLTDDQLDRLDQGEKPEHVLRDQDSD